MNDFTKEELQIIQWEINTAVNKLDIANLSSEKHSALNEKIKSMIDNYPKCDHRSDSWNYNEKGQKVGYPTDIYRCRHCDILFKFIFKNGKCIGQEDLE